MSKEILDTLTEVTPWKSRIFKMPKSNKLPLDWEPGEPHQGNRYYSYIINHWILVQPDSNALMKLFILCDFDLIHFTRLIIDGGNGGKKVKVAA